MAGTASGETTIIRPPQRSRVATFRAAVQGTAYYNIVVPLLMQFYNRVLSRRLQKQGVDFAAFDLMRGVAEAQEYDPNYHLAQLRQRYDHQADSAELQAAVAAFLDRFGHLSDSGNDFSVTPWREQPDIVIVGGGITRQPDPRAAAQAIRRRMKA